MKEIDFKGTFKFVSLSLAATGPSFLFDQKTKQKSQDWANVTLKAFGFTKHLQAASLRGSVLNANPKAFLTLHRPRSSFLTSAEVLSRQLITKHYSFIPEKCRLDGSPIAGMVIRSGEPAQRRVFASF